MLRCSRCSHVFPPKGIEAAPAPPPKAPPAPPTATKPETLSFSFDDDADWSQEPLELDDIPEEQFSLNLADDATIIAPPEPEPEPEPVPEPDPEPPAPRRALEPAPPRVHESRIRAPRRPTPTTPKEDPLANLRWDDPPEADPEPPPRSGMTLRPVFVFLALVVGAYAILARTLYGNPQWSDQLMAAVPPLANAGNERMLNRRVLLINVESRLRHTKEGDDVFLITGNVVNNAAVPLRNVQILAKLLDANGTQIQDQLIFCGNSIPTKMLKDLSSQQVAIIPRLRPNNRFLIQPGEKAPFVIAFVNPPSAVAEFTTQVVSAQRQA